MSPSMMVGKMEENIPHPQRRQNSEIITMIVMMIKKKGEEENGRGIPGLQWVRDSYIFCVFRGNTLVGGRASLAPSKGVGMFRCILFRVQQGFMRQLILN